MLATERESRPTAQDVARRLVILRFVMLYADIAPYPTFYEKEFRTWSLEERRRFEQRIAEEALEHWDLLRRNAYWQFLSRREVMLAETPPRKLTERQWVDAMWRREGVVMLSWALGVLLELPPPDRRVTQGEVDAGLTGDVGRFVAAAQLRDPGEIDRARSVAELWHWRSRTRELIQRREPFPDDETLRNAGLCSYEDIIRLAATKAHENGYIPPPIDGDFPVLGMAYRDLTDDEWAEMRSIAIERHLALNWVCGYAPGNRWDETPTGT